MQITLGVKSDPIEYRYSFPWLFRIMADEGVYDLQLGSFFEIYQLPDSYFLKLREQAHECGVRIRSLFTAHRELGGFFREDPEWADVARRNFERFIEIGSILGATSVGSNPGAVVRDRMELKNRGLDCYLRHFKELMHFAHDQGISCLTVEPMSCLAEPPTLPHEIVGLGQELSAYHQANPGTTCRAGFCTDIAHGYIDQNRRHVHDNFELFRATLPYLVEVHLKNTDTQYNSTFGFEPANLERGIIDVRLFRRGIDQNAGTIPVNELPCFLEIGGPKLGRDFTDYQLEEQLRLSLRHLKDHFLRPPSDVNSAEHKPISASPTVGHTEESPVKIGPSVMCVDPLELGSALSRLEALAVDYLHLDVMDGHFVPNMPLGLEAVRAVSQKSQLPIDIHLMVANPDFFIEQLISCRIDSISVHAETAPHLDRTLSSIKEHGIRAGVALNPGTPLSFLDHVLERLDFVLIMTVNPGFAGQKMTPGSIEKIKQCREKLDRFGHSRIELQVDGNVSLSNIPLMIAAGADSLVAGTSSIFQSDHSWEENLKQSREAVAAGWSQRRIESVR